VAEQLDVVVSELSKASARLRDAGQRLQDGLSSVDLETGQLLGSGWKGDAATAFGSAWDRWHNGAGQVVRGLQSMSELLSVAAKEYAKTDEHGAGAIGSSMQGGAGDSGARSGTGGSGGGGGPSAASVPTGGGANGGGANGGGASGGADQLAQMLPSLAQQMMQSMGQLGQLSQPLTQAAQQAAQLATGLAQQGAQAPDHPSGTADAHKATADEEAAAREAAEKESTKRDPADKDTAEAHPDAVPTAGAPPPSPTRTRPVD